MNETIRSQTKAIPLWSGFRRSAAQFPGRPAVEVNGHTLSYSDLLDRAASLAATLARHSLADAPPLTAVFAYRSATAFSGVLGALFRGHGYVPLNRTFPPERTRLMLECSQCRSVIVDSQSEPQLEQVLADAKAQLLLLFPDRRDVTQLAKRWAQHIVLGADDLEPAAAWSPPEHKPGSIAYLLFTSGSTGTPKGVVVSQDNVRHYVDWTIKRYGITHEDRLSQTFDMTFDLSAHDMFVAWEQGACVCCPSQKDTIKPDRFINNSRLTAWFSVPSTALFMKRLGLLKPGMYRRLRLSLFCGEALPMETVIQWAKAAPNSIIENIYGPTELTIACTAYRWDSLSSPAQCEQGTVPIGQPFAGMDALVTDENLNEVQPGSDGELLMTGPQLSLGYWLDQEKTARAFVVPPGKDRLYYRTGDRVRRPSPGQPMVYLGRMDNQIKILGHRIELGEIEAALRQVSGVDGIVALGWPLTPSGADAIEAFLQTDTIDSQAVLDAVKSRLPAYMVPRALHALPRFPLNSNGKFDRKALMHILSEAKDR
ncbi:MAG TPA: amino acid adenylation domain-containing protein [Verrucomicrobiae bacterium]|nr:amino acid adenylation domain-containing protein [Verrucomicrobiae bacterium]